MHVCHINPPAEFYSPVSGGAVATVIMQQAKELIARGHRVTILTAINEDETYDVGHVVALPAVSREKISFLRRRISSLRQKLNHWDWPFYDVFKAGFSRALRQLSSRPDVIIVHNDLVSPRYLKKICPGAKVIVWLHNEQRTNQPSMAQTIAATDAFVGVSQYIRDWTRTHHRIDDKKVHAILNGVDAAQFVPRANLQLANCAIRVLFIGRIDPNKGPDIAADAVAALRSRGVGAKLTVAGSLWWYGHGDEMSDPFFRALKVKMDAVEADYRGHVTRHQVPAMVREHDVVCVLSRSNEPFGLVALEAMASGCAVIASNRGGLPEACGDAAILVNPDDFEAVVASMQKLATDPAALMQHKRRSVEHAAQSTWKHRVDQLENLLGTLN